MGEGFCNFCIPEYIEKREWRIDRFQSYFFHIDLIGSENYFFFFLKYKWCILSIFDTFHSVFFTCFLTKRKSIGFFKAKDMWQRALVLLSRSNSLEKERCSCDCTTPTTSSSRPCAFLKILVLAAAKSSHQSRKSRGRGCSLRRHKNGKTNLHSTH